MLLTDTAAAGQVFRWYTNNKDWLTATRLPRMMKRLLRRANALNPGENDDFADEQPVETGTAPAAASAELEAKLEQMSQQLGQMAQQLNQTQAQLRQMQQANRRTAEAAAAAATGRTEDSNALEIRVNASLAAHQERLKIQTNMTDESLRKIISSGEQMATRLSKTEKLLETLQNAPNNNCGNCPAAPVLAEADDPPSLSKIPTDDIVKFQRDIQHEVQQLKVKLQMTADDMVKNVNSLQFENEGMYRNFSALFKDGLAAVGESVDDRLSSASSSSYDIITNATLAFGEDLQVLRQAVSSSTAQIQFLVGQDMKSVRGLEELRSGARRHEANIQVLTTQLGEFKFQVQDQLNNIRAHFTQTVNEFYQKIVDRQNAMAYRLTSVVDELSAVKGKGIFTQPVQIFIYLFPTLLCLSSSAQYPGTDDGCRAGRHWR